MILSVAWRNIWRNKIRSTVLILSVSIGVWATIAVLGYSFGVVDAYLDFAIQNELAHIQIHQPEYRKRAKTAHYIPNSSQLVERLQEQNLDISISSRTLTKGIMTGANGAKRILIAGIIPEQEQHVSRLKQHIRQGSLFEKQSRIPQIIISQKMAIEMDLQLKSMVVLRFQNIEGAIAGGKFKVAGIYKSGQSLFDDYNVYVEQKQLNQILGKENICHQVALLLGTATELTTIQKKLKEILPELQVENYREISPEVNLFESQIDFTINITFIIIMLALVFGIINTMLMAVLNRQYELGVLMAIGMHKKQIFWMILLETVLLCVLALPFGLFLGWLSVFLSGSYGIDFANYASGLEQFGQATIVYPQLAFSYYVKMCAYIFITAVLAAIYPARKAVRTPLVKAIKDNG